MSGWCMGELFWLPTCRRDGEQEQMHNLPALDELDGKRLRKAPRCMLVESRDVCQLPRNEPIKDILPEQHRKDACQVPQGAVWQQPCPHT